MQNDLLQQKIQDFSIDTVFWKLTKNLKHTQQKTITVYIYRGTAVPTISALGMPGRVHNVHQHIHRLPVFHSTKYWWHFCHFIKYPSLCEYTRHAWMKHLNNWTHKRYIESIVAYKRSQADTSPNLLRRNQSIFKITQTNYDTGKTQRHEKINTFVQNCIHGINGNQNHLWIQNQPSLYHSSNISACIYSFTLIGLHPTGHPRLHSQYG